MNVVGLDVLLDQNDQQARIQRVLITNDDGYDAVGLEVLKEVAEQIAEEVWVVAPERDQSGSSQSLSLHQPLRARQLGERSFCINGTPSDCVLMGAFHLLPEKPDLVLSGINRGVNTADAVGFSGTLGAALTASLFQIPSVALSQAWKERDNIHWQTARQFAPPILRQLLAQPLPEGLTSNINFPSVAPEEVVGVANASMNGQSLVDVAIDQRSDQRQIDYYWLSFQHKYSDVREFNSDVNLLREKVISVSFIERQLTQGLNSALFQRFS